MRSHTIVNLDELKHDPQAIKEIFTNATYLQDEEINIEGFPPLLLL